MRENGKVRDMKAEGVSKCKNGMEEKASVRWYMEKEAPKHEVWYDGSLGGDLVFRMRAQCMEGNASTYRWTKGVRCVTGVWMRLWCR